MTTNPTASLDRYADEVMAGLPHEKPQLECALENLAFYDRDAERYIPTREAETAFDRSNRPIRQSGLVAEVIDVLTQHLYSPGPARQFDVPEAESFLRTVWTDNLYDALLQRAEALATLNNVCAIQVDAAEGKFAERPLSLRLWGREQFHAWCDPDDCTKPVAVVTIDRYDEQTRYRLWDDSEVRTYLTGKAGGTSGGQVAKEVNREPNSYGVIPFGFIHYDLPVRHFYTPAPGTFLRQAELRVNDRLSLLDESIAKHLNPIPVAENVPLEWNPILEPQRFIRLMSGGPALGPNGFEAGAPARLYYLQAAIDVAGAWDDLMRYVNMVLESSRVPLSAVRMEQTGVASGIALIAEQAPLLTRARARRGVFAHFEGNLTKTVLIAAGNHYGKPGLVAAATKGHLSLGWPEPTIPIPGPDRDEADANELAMGLVSRLMLLQRRYNLTREQAVVLLMQIAEDRKAEDRILPPPEPPPDPNQDPPAGDAEPAADEAPEETDE